MKPYKLILAFLVISIIFGCFYYSFKINTDKKADFENVLNSINDNITLNNGVSAQATSRDEAQLIARAINGEARGESYIGQVAVGAVILNRVSHPSFPKSVPGVIYQPGAFTAVSDGQINASIDVNSTVYKAAKDAINGWDPVSGAIYYYNPAKTTNAWIWSRQVITTIGKHVFAK